MERLFWIPDRDATHDPVIISEIKKYKIYKRLRQRLQRESLWNKCRQEFAETEKNMLSYLLDMVSPKTYTEPSETVLQHLAFVCRYPKYVKEDMIVQNGTIKKRVPQESSRKKLQQRVKKFYKDGDDLQELLMLLSVYINCGTRSINRHVADGKLHKSEDQIKELKETIIGLGREYEIGLRNLYRLHECSYPISPILWDNGQEEGGAKRATIDDNLLRRCITNEWLIPLSSVILVREIQYLCQKKEKYPRNLLLFPKSEKFLSVCKSSNSKSERELPYKLAKAINKKTLKLNKEIQLALEKFFNGVRSTNLVQDIRKDDVEAKHQKQEEAEDGLLYYLIKKTSHQNEDIGLEKHSNSLFQAIRPRIIVLALNIGEAFEMDLEETEKMITCLRCISSERRNINDILQEKGFDPSRKCVKDINLKDVCESIKELINPARYYVAEKTVGEQLKPLKKSLWKLKKAKFASINLNSQVAPEDITARQFFKATKKMIWFQDLSTVALWMSNALIPITDGKKTYHMLPKFLSNSIDALDHNLKHYYQKKMAEWLLGGELTEGGKNNQRTRGDYNPIV